MRELVGTGRAEPDPQDRYDLACIELRRDNWPGCREQMEKLVNSARSDPRYLAAYVEMLVQQEQLVDAELWLNRLERVSQSEGVVALRSELMFRRRSWGAITPYLNAYLEPGMRLGRGPPQPRTICRSTPRGFRHSLDRADRTRHRRRLF